MVHPVEEIRAAPNDGRQAQALVLACHERASPNKKENDTDTFIYRGLTVSSANKVIPRGKAMT